MIPTARASESRLALIGPAAPPNPLQPTITGRARAAATWAVPVALALGVLVRATFVLSADFPLNDGGLFFAMARDLQNSGYALAETASYNAEGIPFAYPPLAMYVAASLDDATPLSLTTVFRFLPAIMSSLAMVAFWLLARRIVSTEAVATALFAFALLPASFMWMIMGGGITRATGLFFALLCLHQVHRMFTQRKPWLSVPAGLLAGLTLLSHLEMAWFVAFSSGLFFLAYGRHRAGITGSLAVATIGVLVAAPWWVSVLVHHGPSPFLEAALSGSDGLLHSVVLLIEFDFTVEPLLALIGSLSLAGVLVCLSQRRYLLPLWILAAGLFDPRAFPTSAAAPAALLAAVGLHDVVLPHLRQAMRWPSQSILRHKDTPNLVTFPPRHSWMTIGVLSAMLCYSMFSALIASPKVMTAMTTDERDAMSWVAKNTPAESRFVVVSGDAWAVDRTSEWFPVLAGRRSLATVQGYEWVADGGFMKQRRLYIDLQNCSNRDVECLRTWEAQYGARFDYVYIPHLVPRIPKTETEICCEQLRESLAEDERYTRVYEGPGASIFEKRD